MKITATIITLDEERNIARAIESLRCADEILIVDSGSVDRTVELARNLGARVIEDNWRGFPAQKNWAAEQALGMLNSLALASARSGSMSATAATVVSSKTV